MKIFYSPSVNGFFHQGIQKIIPEDAIEITEADYSLLRHGLESGKVLSVSDQGVLALVEPPIQQINTPEQERVWRDSELERADKELNKVQDSDPKAVGSVSDWRTYRKALRAWPENKDFPNTGFRPKAPDVK